MGVSERPIALTVAGSDSGGGAGVQADIRVFAALGCHPTTAITALTAQNLDGVFDVRATGEKNLAAQLDALFEGLPPAAAKTGMLWDREHIDVVAHFVRAHRIAWIIDPVMVATSGSRLVSEDAVAAYRTTLCPQATLVTPNLDEAEVLLPSSSCATPAERASALEDTLRCPVLLKGGHSDGDPVDVLCIDGSCTEFPHEKIHGVNTHGTGCTLSAAIAAHLARGLALPVAVSKSIDYVQGALRTPVIVNGIQILNICPEHQEHES